MIMYYITTNYSSHNLTYSIHVCLCVYVCVFICIYHNVCVRDINNILFATTVVNVLTKRIG